MSADREALRRKLLNAQNSYVEGYGGHGAVTSAQAALTKHDAAALLETGGITVVSRVEQASCLHHWIPRAAGAMKCACGASYIHGNAVEVAFQITVRP